MEQGVDVTTTYHTFVSKLDINMWSLLDNAKRIRELMVGIVLHGQMWWPFVGISFQG